ncbi:MAG: hypothetical protein IPN29_14845 [Saprospiraceae bacterium]|nr:hypothetical protein [Saprospiraceae bacterium]
MNDLSGQLSQAQMRVKVDQALFSTSNSLIMSIAFRDLTVKKPRDNLHLLDVNIEAYSTIAQGNKFLLGPVVK